MPNQPVANWQSVPLTCGTALPRSRRESVSWPEAEPLRPAYRSGSLHTMRLRAEGRREGEGSDSQNVPAQVFVLHRLCKHALHVRGIDRDRLATHVAGFERKLVKKTLQDRVKAARTYV